MCHHLRMLGFRRVGGLAYRHQTAVRYYRHAIADILFANEVDKIALGRRHIQFSCKESGILLCSAWSCVDALS